MGRNKIRARAVDVTKSLLQPTSVTDHIAVQVGPTTIIQVGEEDLSPTQGSEAAFALRREGKLDTTMKLCVNWRLGNCHNHAACSFAHVTRYFGQAGDSASPATTGRAAVLGGPYSSVPAAGSSARAGGGGGAAAATAAQPDKLSPPFYPAANRNTAPVRTDERRATTATSANPAATAPTVAAATAAVRSPDVPSLPARSQAGEAAPAPPTQASAAVIAPAVRPAAVEPTPPAVVSAEGLRGILLSLSTTVGAAAAAAASAARPAATTTAPEERKEGSVNTASHHPRHFLGEVEAAALQLPAPAWQERPCTTETEIINTVGQLMVGAAFDTGLQPVKFWQRIFSINTKEQWHDLLPGQPLRDATASSPMVQPSLSTTPERAFNSAPAASGRGQQSEVRNVLGALHAGSGGGEGDLSVPGLSYQHLMNLLPPEE